MPVAGLRSGLPRPVGTVQPLVPRSAEPSVRWAALSPRHHRGTATKPRKGPARCAETTTGLAGLKIVSLCEPHHSRSPLNYRELPLPDCRRHKMIDRCLSALATGYVTVRHRISRRFGKQNASSLHLFVASLRPERRHRSQIVPFRQYALQPTPCAAIRCTSHSIPIATAGSSLGRNTSLVRQS